MAVEFRCENCGKMLNVDADPGSTVKCPLCRKKVAVPEALAALPRPHVPPNAPPPPPPGAGPPPEGEEQLEEEAGEGDAVMGAMAMIMPWVISVFLHLGLFLIMLFFVMVTANTGIPDSVIVPDATLSDTPGGVRDPLTKETSRSHEKKRTVVKRRTERKDTVDQGKTETKVRLFAASADGSAGGDAELGLTNSDSRGGPKSNFYGSGGNAYHIVYVVDRSGSMSPTFDEVRIEMLKSIGRLQMAQDFHIILFSDNEVIEGPGSKLVPADDTNKLAATRFLMKVTAFGQTTALKALQRAFSVLRYTNERPGKLIYLLTDGDFHGVTGGSTYKNLKGNEAVVQWLKDNNKAHDVYINTYLYLGNDETARKVMQTISEENGGRFKQISADE